MRRVRRLLLRGTAAATLLTAAVLSVMPASQAEAPTVVGWWYRDVPLSSDEMEAQSIGAPVVARISTGPARTAQVPPPPGWPPAPLPTTPPEATIPDPTPGTPTPSPAPDGGLLVAADVTGVRAMSALRFAVSNVGTAVLTLTLAPGSTLSPGVRACPALSDWLPGADQPWSDRPAHDCGRLAVSTGVSPDGTQMIWRLPEGFAPRGAVFYDVLLVPISGDGTPFQIAFEKPDASSFEVTSVVPVDAPPATSDAYGDAAPVTEYYDPGGFGDVDYGYGGGGSLPDLPEGTVEFTPAGDAKSSNPFVRAASALENPTTRRIATALLVVLGGLAYWQSSQTVQRAPRLLGALGGSSVMATGGVRRAARPRGIGRFARVRTERPPRL